MTIKGYILRTALFLLTSGLFLSCEDLGSLINNPQTSIDTEYYEMDFSIQSSDRGGFHIFAEELFSTEINNSLNEAGFAEYQIESVILTEAQINLLEAESIKDFGITAQGYLKKRVYENVNLHARVKFQVWVKL